MDRRIRHLIGRPRRVYESDEMPYYSHAQAIIPASRFNRKGACPNCARVAPHSTALCWARERMHLKHVALDAFVGEDATIIAYADALFYCRAYLRAGVPVKVAPQGYVQDAQMKIRFSEACWAPMWAATIHNAVSIDLKKRSTTVRKLPVQLTHRLLRGAARDVDLRMALLATLTLAEGDAMALLPYAFHSGV